MQEVGGKKQIIYQKPGDCLKHLIRSLDKMCAKDQETQVLKQNPCTSNWQSKRDHGVGGEDGIFKGTIDKGSKTRKSTR